jgi:hypothetical protein
VWWDDRYGHHVGPWGGEHWGDVMAAPLPYVEGFSRLTQAQPYSMDLIAFEAGRVLMNKPGDGLDAYEVRDLASDTALPIAWAVPQGARVLDMSTEHLLVRREPLNRCHLELVHLETQRSFELDTQGYCPTQAAVDREFVIWLKALESSTELYWMDIGDLR